MIIGRAVGAGGSQDADAAPEVTGAKVRGAYAMIRRPGAPLIATQPSDRAAATFRIPNTYVG